MSTNRVRVAVVTGGNRGVGYAVVRRLCRQFKGDVFIAARDLKLGAESVERLKGQGLHPKLWQLDLNRKESIARLALMLKNKYGGLDVLVNNAAMAYKFRSEAPFSEQAERTIATNFTGTLDVCDTLFPLLRPHARVVNMSCLGSFWALVDCNRQMKKKFTSKDLTMDELKLLMSEFVNAAQNGTHKQSGFGNSAYAMSKVGINCMTFIQQRTLEADSREDIIVNTCCPGPVTTELSSYTGVKTIDEGADTPTYLALLPPDASSPKGQYVSERAVVPWKPSQWLAFKMTARYLFKPGYVFSASPTSYMHKVRDRSR